MENDKIYIQRIITVNGEGIPLEEERYIKMSESEYEAKMKEQQERKEKIQNLLVDMMVDYAIAKRKGLV